MYKIFCNSCYAIRHSTFSKFYIISCSHIFCKSCLQNCKYNSKQRLCLICKSTAKFLEINDDMPASVKRFFISKSIENNIKEIERINQFQTAQWKLFITKTKEHKLRYEKAKDSIKKLNVMGNELQKRINQEKEQIEKLKDAFHSNNITADLFQQHNSPSIPLPPRALKRSSYKMLREFLNSSQK